MITRRRLLMLAFCVIFGAALALALAGFILSGAAKADSGDFVRVEVYWSGTDCIGVYQATGDREIICGGHETFTAVSGPGRTVGIDPVMGAASQISCSFYLNGSLEYVDMAFAGDGTDVNCIREIYVRGPQNGMYV